MDHVEQANRLGGLIGLQSADRVKAKVGILGKQQWPFGKGFLNAALAKVLLAGLDQRFDFLRRAAFADGNQLNI